MPFHATRLCLLAVLLVATSGCVREDVNGATHSFSYELWLPLLVLVGGIAAAPAGWALRKKTSRYGWGLLILAPIAAIGVAPSLFLERSVVGEEVFTMRSGIMGLTVVHDIRYDDLKSVRIVSEETTGRKGRKKTNYYMVCALANGETAKVPINNNVSEAAAPAFLQRAADHGVPITNET